MNQVEYSELIEMKILGIDLGTANTCMAVMEAGKPIVIPNAEGSRMTPSVVWFSSSGERLVGQKAREKAILNPERTVYSIKRFMGKYYDCIETKRDLVQYEIVEGPFNDARVKIDCRLYSPQEISAIILKRIKDDAELFLGEKIEKAVITVPAYYNDSQNYVGTMERNVAFFKLVTTLWPINVCVEMSGGSPVYYETMK